MTTAVLVVGILVGWAATGRGWSGGWMAKIVGVIGGLIGAYLAVTLSAEPNPVSTAIWAWAGSHVLGDLISYFMPSKG